ncbi:hypothetical protein SDJN03_06840, partial [Cucurbita argyrosperma subsp. sororia]
MAGLLGLRGLAPKTKNIVVAGGLTAFVFGVYFYTMRAVGGSDELQVAIDQFEAQKDNKDSNVGVVRAILHHNTTSSEDSRKRDDLITETKLKLRNCEFLPRKKVHA